MQRAPTLKTRRYANSLADRLCRTMPPKKGNKGGGGGGGSGGGPPGVPGREIAILATLAGESAGGGAAAPSSAVAATSAGGGAGDPPTLTSASGRGGGGASAVLAPSSVPAAFRTGAATPAAFQVARSGACHLCARQWLWWGGGGGEGARSPSPCCSPAWRLCRVRARRRRAAALCAGGGAAPGGRGRGGRGLLGSSCALCGRSRGASTTRQQWRWCREAVPCARSPAQCFGQRRHFCYRGRRRGGRCGLICRCRQRRATWRRGRAHGPRMARRVLLLERGDGGAVHGDGQEVRDDAFMVVLVVGGGGGGIWSACGESQAVGRVPPATVVHVALPLPRLCRHGRDRRSMVSPMRPAAGSAAAL
jgi:hypothetical protein